MPTSEAKKIVKKYSEILRQKNFSFSNVYLFGSCSLGKQNKESDIDVAVVVNHIGSDRNYIGKKMRLWEFTSDIDTCIEPILIEYTDFQKGRTILASQVKKHGIRIV